MTAATAGRELQARQRVDRNGVGIDALHLAEGDSRAAGFQQSADAPVQAGQIGARDRPVDEKRELAALRRRALPPRKRGPI